MSAAGRVSLAALFGTTEYMKWASSPFHLIDARKIALEFSGKRRPDAGSPYAKAIIGLCREHPPTSPGEPEPPPPPPLPELAPIWLRDAVYTTALGNFDGDRRHPAKAAGYSVVYVNLTNAAYYDNNVAHMELMTREGWSVVGWGTYGQDTDPYQDGIDAAAVTLRFPQLKGFKGNGEAWAEGPNSWKTEAFIRGYREGGGRVPLGFSVSSSDTDQYARPFAYDQALAVAGADIDLQVYGATYPTYTVAAGLGMLRRTPVPLNRTTITGDITQTGRGPFADYRTWQGPRRIWIGEWSTAETWAALTR